MCLKGLTLLLVHEQGSTNILDCDSAVTQILSCKPIFQNDFKIALEMNLS